MLPMPKRMLTYRNSDRFSSPILASDVCPAGLEEPESVKEEIPCDAGFSALTWKFRSKDYQIQVDERPSVKGKRRYAGQRSQSKEIGTKGTYSWLEKSTDCHEIFGSSDAKRKNTVNSYKLKLEKEICVVVTSNIGKQLRQVAGRATSSRAPKNNKIYF